MAKNNGISKEEVARTMRDIFVESRDMSSLTEAGIIEDSGSRFSDEFVAWYNEDGGEKDAVYEKYHGKGYDDSGDDLMKDVLKAWQKHKKTNIKMDRDDRVTLCAILMMAFK